MATSIRILSQARTDIVELAVYIGQDDINAASRFLDAIDETFALLARQPFIGAKHTTKNSRLEEIRVIRVKKFPNHLTFYMARDNEIEIVRVLHGARDFDTAFNS